VVAAERDGGRREPGEAAALAAALVAFSDKATTNG
jgi:hypothetical protein